MTYNNEEIEYFYEIALGVEYGQNDSRTKKWQTNPNIATHGTPTAADLDTLDNVIKELNNGLIHDGIKLELDEASSNIEIHFEPESQFANIEPNYVPGNSGFFYAWWNSNCSIYRARILISTDVTQQARSHLIREELTQSLGLMNDSSQYNDSIFYQGWTETNTYTDMDKAVIEIMYNAAVHPNMTYSDLTEIVTTLTRPPKAPQNLRIVSSS